MITAIIQARMGSTRLPGKVLKMLAGQPMIAHVIQRTRAACKLDQVVLATTQDASDDPLAEFAASLGVVVFRGSVDDVLDRYYQAAKSSGATTVIRITGDCPVIDPAVIDATVGLFQSGDYDYVSNFIHRTYPDGLDTEVMRFSALETAWQEAALKSEREHVTPYLYKHPEKFQQVGLVQPIDLSAYRWTVDEPRDFEFITAIYDALYTENPSFDMAAIAKLLDNHPELLDVNAGISGNEGYLKSLEEDKNSQ
jgi:spore coat polysaccharide biosynthesis protein SpsF